MLARENAERLGLVDRVRFLRSNLLESVEPDFDMIAANLPYISTEDRQNLSREVLQDRKSTRLNSSHSQISYAVFCLKKQTQMSDSFHSLPNQLLDNSLSSYPDNGRVASLALCTGLLVTLCVVIPPFTFSRPQSSIPA